MNKPHDTILRVLLLSVPSIALAASAHAAKSPQAKSQVYDLDKSSGAVTFDAIGKPSALKIHGKGDSPKGQLKLGGGKLNGTATFKLESLDTGISLRNKHMKEKYLEVSKYPEAKLTFHDLAVPPAVGEGDFSSDKLPYKGTLSLHGVEKPVEGTAKVNRKGENLSVDTRFELKTSDFGISTPSFSGVTMGENVTVQVQTSAPLRAE